MADQPSSPDALAIAASLARSSGGAAEGSAGAFALGLVFSGVGFVGLAYGKKLGNFRAMALGGALMIYPYLVDGLPATAAVGALLTVALWRAR